MFIIQVFFIRWRNTLASTSWPFNKCLATGTCPKIWNFANICPNPKPGKMHTDAKNFRPTAVSSCLGRLYEKTLAKGLQHYCVKNKMLNGNQGGFQMNRSTDRVGIFARNMASFWPTHFDFSWVGHFPYFFFLDNGHHTTEEATVQVHRADGTTMENDMIDTELTISIFRGIVNGYHQETKGWEDGYVKINKRSMHIFIR